MFIINVLECSADLFMVISKEVCLFGTVLEEYSMNHSLNCSDLNDSYGFDALKSIDSTLRIP
jgi:hypothetical protein